MDDLAASFRRLAHAARVASDQFKATAPLLKKNLSRALKKRREHEAWGRLKATECAGQTKQGNRNPVSTTPRPRRWEYALLIALILEAAWFAAAGRGLL
jgi:hypothetical protein